jgi:hypothetical protein
MSATLTPSATVGTCIVCGNEYGQAFDVVFKGQLYTFDSFECAIHRLAPLCEHCGCRVIGHGVELGSAIFCCAHCARRAGKHGVVDHAPQP